MKYENMKQKCRLYVFLISFFTFHTSYFSFAQQDTLSIPPSEDNDTTLNNSNLPVFSTTTSDMGNDAQSQDVNSLLSSSRDIYVQITLAHFYTARFRYRGYTSDNMTVLMNGIRINSLYHYSIRISPIVYSKTSYDRTIYWTKI